MRLLTRARKFLWRRVPRKKLKLGAATYTFPVVSSNMLVGSNEHESWLDDILAAAFACKPGSILDVGANRGQTLMKMLALDPSRPYVGFEPQAAAAGTIEQFIVENRLTHCSILPIGLSNASGCVQLHARGRGYNSMFSQVSTIVSEFRPSSFYGYTKYVYVGLGDDVVQSLGLDDIAVIKIDVEGAELEVIEGLPRTIAAHRPLLFFEVLHHYLAATKSTISDEIKSFRAERVKRLEAQIRAHDYEIYRINGRHSLDRVEEIVPAESGPLDTTDYVAVHEDQAPTFTARVSETRPVAS